MSTASKFASPLFASAKLDAQKRLVPQCVAHRGYKATCPENTLLAFRSAIAAGADAIETDIHLTKDNVVVLSHDANLKRCFGRPEKIIDMNWSEVQKLRTIRTPHEQMPRLIDLLDLLSEDDNLEKWCLLDIKIDNNHDDVMRLIGDTIKSHSPRSGAKPWNQRIALGIWTAKFLPLCLKYLPGFPVIHIGVSVIYASYFFETENVGFNILFTTLFGPGGRSFIHASKKKYHRPVIAWTVNHKDSMAWCVRKGLDAVITDDPSLFIQVRDCAGQSSPLLPLSVKTLFETACWWIASCVLLMLYWRRFTPVASKRLIAST